MKFVEEREKLKVKLRYFNYSERTIEIYSHYLIKFLQTVNKYPQHLTSADFQGYLNYLSYLCFTINSKNLKLITKPRC